LKELIKFKCLIKFLIGFIDLIERKLSLKIDLSKIEELIKFKGLIKLLMGLT
jgi:hypothetical protein